jgi:hypothetical protein
MQVPIERVREIVESQMEAINDTQKKGFTIDEVLCALMVTLGSTLRQRGVILDLDKPVREALSPLAMGYEYTMEDCEFKDEEELRCG